MITYFRHEDTEGVGFIAVNDARKELYISFRGSVKVANFVTNVQMRLVKIPWSYSGNDEPKVHKGFINAYNSIKDEIKPAIQSLAEANPTYTIRLVGHSLGGALAIVCGVDLKETMSLKNKMIVTVYGVPRTGNAAFASLFQSHFPEASDRTRLTNGNDIVPHLAPLRLNYRHGTHEVYIPPHATNDTLPFACDPNNGEDARCGDAYLGDSVIDHLIYPYGLVFGSLPDALGTE